MTWEINAFNIAIKLTTDLGLRISLGLQNYRSSAQVVIITNLSLANSGDQGSAILKLTIPQSYLAIPDAVDKHYLLKCKSTSYLSKPRTVEGYCLVRW